MQRKVQKIGVLLSLALSTVAYAESEGPFTFKRSAVGNQEIYLQRGQHLDRDCTPHFPIRIAAIIPPKNGQIIEREVEVFSNFGKDSERIPCNEKRSKAIAAFYRANDNFKGSDNFEFIIVFFDGTSRRYKIEMTVW
jgi:hypothetical protein